MWPDELGKGFQNYVKLEIERVVYDFMCTYVCRMKPYTRWKKLLTNDSRIITGEEPENYEDDDEEKIVYESKEDDDDNNNDNDNDNDDDNEEGHQKRCSNRGEK